MHHDWGQQAPRSSRKIPPSFSTRLPDGVFVTHTTFLAQLDTAAVELASHVQNQRTQEALLKQLEVQIVQTDACIKGAADTQGYARHLDSMAGYFKSLPQIIMKSQLQKLCHAMDEIIAGFHFYQPFRLGINDQLDFILQHPNKLTRPIGKASGGERIILGFAFRLAANRTLAPEMPWIAIDEPTNHLADENISVMADVIRTCLQTSASII